MTDGRKWPSSKNKLMGRLLPQCRRPSSFIITSRKRHPIACLSMWWVVFLWLALPLSQAQGRLPTHRRPQFQHSQINIAATPTYDCHLQRLTMTRRHLEVLTSRLSLNVQELLAKRNHAHEELQEPWNQGKCECESAGTSTAPKPTPAQPAEHSSTSWRLEPTETASSGSTSDENSHSGSFLTSTTFALALFFMAIPVACVIGFVLFCKRRRRRQHTHA
ncbi:hypothetical protein V7S43_002869 [Phytophthora oleae]|uniref:Uncharacterized protein n=1 Tax=Phytophthora oleae TaxID=2107226 RepID=A0ABD3G0S0_9STRA